MGTRLGLGLGFRARLGLLGCAGKASGSGLILVLGVRVCFFRVGGGTEPVGGSDFMAGGGAETAGGCFFLRARGRLESVDASGSALIEIGVS